MTVHKVQRPPIRPSRYEAPASTEGALALLSEHRDRGRIVAGGTDVMIELDHRLGGDVDVLIDVTRIPGLDTVTSRDGYVRLGPLVTHNQCATNELVVAKALPLAQACLEVGSPALRNRATVVGNVVTASPANDTITALAVLGAELTIESVRGRRTIELDSFHHGVRHTDLEPDEMVTAVAFPEMHEATRGVFVKLGLRRAQAISVVHLAASCTFGDHVVSEARIAVGSVAPTIVRAREAESVLVGAELGPATIERAASVAASSVAPIDDLRGTADYRRELVEIMVSRALSALAKGEERLAYPTAVPMLGGPNLPADGTGTSLGPGDRIASTINGVAVEADWTPASLLHWIRDGAGLSGTKEACGEGECGACTVHVDGVATLSCLVPAGRAHGSSVTTVEGLTRGGQLHPLQHSFIDSAAVQCGYCTPGLLMAGASLLDERVSPTPQDVRLGLSGNLCRCTGYYSIEAAVVAAGRA